MIATLYEISEDLRAVIAAIEASEDGEVSPEAEARLDAAAGEFADKVDAILRYRVGLVASAEGIDVEIKRLTALRDGYARRAEWLKRYVESCMMATGQVKLQTKLFKLWLQKNGRPAIFLADGASVPEGFRQVRILFDSQKAYEAWKAGQELPDAIRVVHGDHLRIR